MKTATATILAIISTGCYDIGIKATECSDVSAESIAKDGGKDNTEDGNNGIGNDDVEDAEEVASTTEANGTGSTSNAGGNEESHLNGDRIKRRGFEADDGAYQFVGWHDSELGEDCTFRETTPGEFHCLANKPAMAHPWHYADAGCTIQIADYNSNMGSEGQSTRYDYTANRQVYANWSILEELDVSTAYVLTEDGNCVDSGYHSFGSWVHVEQISNDLYVAAVEVID